MCAWINKVLDKLDGTEARKKDLFSEEAARERWLERHRIREIKRIRRIRGLATAVSLRIADETRRSARSESGGVGGIAAGEGS